MAVSVDVVVVDDDDDGGEDGVDSILDTEEGGVEASTSSSVVLRYLNLPLRRCASTVGSSRACSRATWMSMVDGSIAVMDAARVAVGAGAEGSRGIVRASDSAKMPPPQPISI